MNPLIINDKLFMKLNGFWLEIKIIGENIDKILYLLSGDLRFKFAKFSIFLIGLELRYKLFLSAFVFSKENFKEVEKVSKVSNNSIKWLVIILL